MAIIIKLLVAIAVGILMIVGAIILFMAVTFFIGIVAEVLGFTTLAEGMRGTQKRVTKRLSKWFNRYNP